MDSPVGLCFRGNRKGDVRIIESYLVIAACAITGMYDCQVVTQYPAGEGYAVDHGGEILRSQEFSGMEHLSRDEYDRHFYQAIQYLTEKHKELA